MTGNIPGLAIVASLAVGKTLFHREARTRRFQIKLDGESALLY
jgi:hypothetical protein